MYIPKSKIKTNLYTQGNQFILVASGQPYSGYYHELFNGQTFTGKNPNDANVQKLRRIQNATLGEKTEEKAYKIPLDESAITYNYIRNKESNLVKVLPRPMSYTPRPTEEDYKLGEIQRFFVKKNNEIKFVEISKNSYRSFKDKNNNVNWKYYTPFSLPWIISGEPKEVATLNKNSILYTEKKLKTYGLEKFLTNPLLFYK